MKQKNMPNFWQAVCVGISVIIGCYLSAWFFGASDWRIAAQEAYHGLMGVFVYYFVMVMYPAPPDDGA